MWNGTERNGTAHCEANRAIFTVTVMAAHVLYSYRECTEYVRGGLPHLYYSVADDFHPRSKIA